MNFSKESFRKLVGQMGRQKQKVFFEKALTPC
jgi:hypothetical protein